MMQSIGQRSLELEDFCRVRGQPAAPFLWVCEDRWHRFWMHQADLGVGFTDQKPEEPKCYVVLFQLSDLGSFCADLGEEREGSLLA